MGLGVGSRGKGHEHNLPQPGTHNTVMYVTDTVFALMENLEFSDRDRQETAIKHIIWNCYEWKAEFYETKLHWDYNVGWFASSITSFFHCVATGRFAKPPVSDKVLWFKFSVVGNATPPQRCPFPSPWNPLNVILHYKRDFADVKLWIFIWGNYPGLSRGAHCKYKDSYKKEAEKETW